MSAAQPWRFERVAGPFGGPVTGVACVDGGVLFALPDAMEIRRLDPQTGTVSVHRRYTGRVDGIAAAPDGSLYAAQNSGRRVIALQADGSARVTATRLDGALHNFPSDVVTDRRQRVWFCDSKTGVQVFGPRIFPLLNHASVLRLQRDDRRAWQLSRITFDTTAPRALLLSRDETTLFVADGEAQRGGARELRSYPVREDGSVGAYRVLFAFGADHSGVHRGIEGLCSDAAGRLIACSGAPGVGPGPMVHLFDATGRLLQAHAFPADAAPARCAVAAGDPQRLYVGAGDGCLYGATLPE